MVADCAHQRDVGRADPRAQRLNRSAQPGEFGQNLLLPSAQFGEHVPYDRRAVTAEGLAASAWPL